jgi:hypothetical protein
MFRRKIEAYKEASVKAINPDITLAQEANPYLSPASIETKQSLTLYKFKSLLTLGNRNKWVMPLVIILCVTGIGTYLIVESHAEAVGGWSAWNQLDPGPGTTNVGPAVVSWGPGRWDMVQTGTDNALYWRYFDIHAGGLSPWVQISGPNTTNQSPTIASWGPGRLDVFVRGMNGIIYHKAYSGGVWSGWDNMGVNISTPSAPSAISWGANRIDLFWRGVDSNVGQLTWNGSSWNGPYAIGGGPNITYQKIAVSSWAPGRLDLFIEGTDTALYQKYFSGGVWSNWIQLSGPGTTDSAPAAVSRQNNNIDVFVRGTDNAIYHKQWTGSYWTAWDSNTNAGPGTTYSSPAVASWSNRRLDLFVRGTDNAIYWKYYVEPTDSSIGSSLALGQTMAAGTAIVSPSDIYEALMQTDGNFVVYQLDTGIAKWASGTNGSGASLVNFQTDGNLVIKTPSGAGVWTSATGSYGGVKLTMQDDGNLVMYPSSGPAVWSSWYGPVIPAPTASLSGPSTTTIGSNPTLTIKSTYASTCNINGTTVPVNGNFTEPTINNDTTYTLTCSNAGRTATSSLTITATLPDMTHTPQPSDPTAGVTLPGAGIASGHESYTYGNYTDPNWTGYVDVGNGSSFSEAEATVKVPNVSCPTTIDNAALSVWVGLDGTSLVKNESLEQLGFEVDCTNWGKDIQYNTWAEMIPYSEGTHFITINPGDNIFMKVWYNSKKKGFNFYEHNLTLGNAPYSSYSQFAKCPTGYVCPGDTAEFIVEKPDFNNGTLYPFNWFGSVNFSGAQVSTAPGYELTDFGGYWNYTYNIINSNVDLVSFPLNVYGNTSSFTITQLNYGNQTKL